MIQPERIFIFTGPTLSPEIAVKTLNAVYLPPVRLGDVYQICQLFSPQVIGIIDGYFNQVPAVWHKEILYAISQGINVIGAASMGALRAAELNQLGMIGCGEIYKAYQRGTLAPFNDEVFEDDDEVAVIHGPAELNYLAASDALINIRFTLANAMQLNVIEGQVGRQLAAIAKHLFYAKRNYASILEIAQQQGLPETQLLALRDWLKLNKIDQKQRDAITLLETIQSIECLPGVAQMPDKQPFECTSQWQAAVDEIEHSKLPAYPAINELRLRGDNYFQALREALTLPLPANVAAHPPDPTVLTQLHQSPEILKSNLSGLWHKKRQSSDSETTSAFQEQQRLLCILEKSGLLVKLEKRAQDKQAVLDQLQQKPHIDSLNELNRLQLCDWYFSTRLKTQMPNHIQKYTMELGFEDDHDFYAMLLAEYLYVESKQKELHHSDSPI